MTSGSSQKFLFDNCFDRLRQLEEEIEEEEVEPPPPTFSEEELAAARAEGFAQGRAEGVAETQAGIDVRITALLEEMIGQLQTFGGTQTRALEEAENKLLSLACGIARKVVPAAAREHAEEAVEAMIRDCLPKLREEPKVVIRVHEAVLDPLRGKMDALAVSNGFDGDVILLADEALSETDCRVEWSDGGAEQTTEEIWEEIDKAVSGYLSATAVAGDPADTPEPEEIADGPEQDEENLNG